MTSARAREDTRTRRRRRAQGLAAVVVACACAFADDGRAGGDGAPSSILAFVDAVATSMEERARAEDAAAPVDIEVRPGRGMDPGLVERAFTARLRQRLRERGVLPPATSAPLRARLVLSVEGTRLWVVGQLEGGKLPGPSSLAVSRVLDRELEVLVGKTREPARARWTLERLGPVDAGVLDVALTDVDGDFVDDIVVLHIDGVRAFRFAPGDARPIEIGKRVALAPHRWPRTVAGWIAPRGQGRVWVSTTRGELVMVDVLAGTASELPQRGTPLRQPPSSSDAAPILLASGGVGTPLLSFPLRAAEGAAVVVDGASGLVFRDIAQLPGRRDAWVWVDAEGYVGALVAGRPAARLSDVERVGDRFVVVDLDGDGTIELVTSAATAPREADLLSILRTDRLVTTAEPIFHAPLAGGEIVALAVGDLDLDLRPDVVIVEESDDAAAMVWRLEHTP